MPEAQAPKIDPNNLDAQLAALNAQEIKRKEQQVEEQDKRQKIAWAKLADIVRSYPQDTPPDHTIFGYGAKIVKLKDLQDLLKFTPY